MKKTIQLSLILILTAGILRAQNSVPFIHLAKDLNTSSHWTKMSRYGIDSNSNIALLHTHNHNPEGRKSIVSDHKTGVYYFGGFWRVFNQDFAVMDTSISFNILMPGNDVKSWVHLADSTNISGNYTVVSHPAIDGDSSAVFFVSDVWNFNGKPGVYNTNIIGVFYNNSKRKWCIFHQDGFTPMVKNSSYCIVIPEKFSNIVRYVHRSNKDNVISNGTVIDHPDANNNPKAKIFITQNWNPSKKPGKYNNKNVGVFYNGSRWIIYNEDLLKMDTAVSFNVMIYGEKTSNLSKQEMNSQVHMFPNPVRNGSNLEISIQNSITGTFEIEIVDLNGKSIISQTVLKSGEIWKDALWIEGLRHGIYMLKISGNGFISVQRFVIE